MIEPVRKYILSAEGASSDEQSADEESDDKGEADGVSEVIICVLFFCLCGWLCFFLCLWVLVVACIVCLHIISTTPDYTNTQNNPKRVPITLNYTKTISNQIKTTSTNPNSPNQTINLQNYFLSHTYSTTTHHTPNHTHQNHPATLTILPPTTYTHTNQPHTTNHTTAVDDRHHNDLKPR